MTQKGRRAPCLPISIVLSLGASALWAQPAFGSELPVLLSDAPCGGVDRAELRRLLAIELGSRLATKPLPQEGFTLRLECQTDTVTLVVAGGQGEQLRTLHASDAAGEVGARLISLSLVEMLHEAERPAAPARPPPVAETAPPVEAPRRDRARSMRLLALAQVLTPRLDGSLSGFGLAADYVASSPFSARLETAFSRSERRFELGTTQTELATVTLAGGYTGALGPVRPRVMAGFRLGSARISGERSELPGTRESSVSGPWGGPLVSAGLGFVFFETLAFELGGEAGYVSLPVVGEVEGEDAIALDGYWLAANVGLGATF